MRKEEFLRALKSQLSGLPSPEIQDILRDQEEYIDDAVRSGRSEETVVASLGDPKAFASGILAEARIKSAESTDGLGSKFSGTWKALVAILALAPLNVLIVLGPFLVLVAMLFAGWAVSLGLFLAAWAVLIAFLFKLVFITVGVWAHLSAFFFTVGWIGVGLLGLLLMAQATRFFLQGTLAYLKWNVNFVQGNR